jgi:hypothetical protein
MTLCFLDKVSTRTGARGYGLVRRLILYLTYIYEQDGVGWAKIREVQ